MSRDCKNPNCKKAVTGHPNKRFCKSKCKDRYHNAVAHEAALSSGVESRIERYDPQRFKTPWGSQGVSRARYEECARKYGGHPLFDRHGICTGFIPGAPFDNSTDHQNSGEEV